MRSAHREGVTREVMGVGHHFIPVSILGAFACAEAVELLPPGTPVARERFLRTFDDPRQRRRRPVAVLRKGHGGPGRLLCQPAEAVCAHPGLYALPGRSDPVTLGAALAMVNSPLALGLRTPTAEDDLMVWAREAGRGTDVDVLERELARRLDGPVAVVLSSIRASGRIRLEDRRLLATFLEVAMVRVRYWFEVNAQSLGDRAVSVMGSFPEIRIDPEDHHTREFLGLYQSLARPMAFPLLLSGALAMDPPFFERRGLRLILLACSGDARFVTSDNPARPFLRSRGRHLRSDAYPGFQNPATWMVFPFSPRHALATTTSRAHADLSTVVLGDDAVREINLALLTMAVEEVVLPGPSLTAHFPSGFDALNLPRWREPGKPMFSPGF